MKNPEIQTTQMQPVQRRQKMKKKFALITALTVLAMLLTVAPVSADAIVTKEIIVEEIDNNFPDVCGIEDIHVKGTQITRISTVLDGNGVFHFNSNYNWEAFTGTGLTSGDTYIVTTAFSNVSKNEDGTYTLIFIANLVSKGSGKNIQLKGVNHLTVNGNGDITVEKTTSRIMCK